MQGKKTKGRKRHILVDTLGLMIDVLIHSAGIQDRNGGKILLSKAKMNGATFTKVFADGGYQGTLIDWAKKAWDIELEIVKRSYQKKFIILPKRWIVERTLSWINRYRRLAKDFERFGKTVRSWIFLAMTRLMLKRLAKTYT